MSGYILFIMFVFLGEDFLTVQKEVADLIKGRILVGHALQNDMKVCIRMYDK